MTTKPPTVSDEILQRFDRIATTDFVHGKRHAEMYRRALGVILDEDREAIASYLEREADGLRRGKVSRTLIAKAILIRSGVAATLGRKYAP